MATQNSRGFAEKVALITDGANDVGRAVALQLALQGCYVIVGFRETTAETSRALSELQSIGTLANAIEADVSTIEGVNKLFRTVEQTYGRLDLLANTTNFEPTHSFTEIDENLFIEAINRNLKSVFFCSQAALSLMKNRPSPSIVNVFVDAEKAGNLLFSAIQNSLVGLTKSLSVALAPKIRVNGVALQSIKSLSDAEKSDEFEFLESLQNFSADEAARAATYFLSSEAKALSGQILVVGEKRAKL